MTNIEVLKRAGCFKSIAVTGICKNAGKTTVLNRLIQMFSHETLGLTSIGRDGEPFDAVTGAPKPIIHVRKGTFIATANVSGCDVTKEMLCVTGVMTPLGEVVVFRAATDGFVELAGASDRLGSITVKEKLFSLGASRVFIDGAAGRRIHSYSSIADGVILCASAEYDSDIKLAADETYRIVKLMTIPVYPAGGVEDILAYDGLFTDSDAERFFNNNDSKKAILFQDQSAIFLSLRQLERLESRVRLYVKKASDLIFIALNPYSTKGYYFDNQVFKRMIQEKTEIPVINMEE